VNSQTDYPAATLLSLSAEVLSHLKVLAARDGRLPEELAADLILAELPSAVARAVKRRVAATRPTNATARHQAPVS
jgi:hypothetical protein